VHPEKPARSRAVIDAWEKSGLAATAWPLTQQPAEPDDVLLCHTRDYWKTVQEDFAAGAQELSTGDTVIGPQSLDIALRAVGGVMNAVDAVMTGKLTNAFCAVRPPGHHARPAQGMGFCLFNNIAIAARHAQQRHGAGKVLIVDWDVHHGNGTQDIFYRDPSVLFVSLHESPLYPDSGFAQEVGDGDGRGTTVNVPLPAGSDGGAYALAFERVVLPILQQWSPDLLLISAGFDAHARDPLANMLLEDHDYRWMAASLRDVAHLSAGGRVGVAPLIPGLGDAERGGPARRDHRQNEGPHRAALASGVIRTRAISSAVGCQPPTSPHCPCAV
jgi:acetoin utilization deacetylase AcuC-like enzyme